MGTIRVIPGEPGRLIVQFSFSQERVAAIKTVPGRRWHPKEKYWTVPRTPEVLERVRSVFITDRVSVSAAVEVTSPRLPAAEVSRITAALDAELTLRGYSDRTRENYGQQLLRFLKWLRRDPATAENDELQAYLLDILDDGLSASYARQARATLIILYQVVLEQPKKVVNLPSAKADKQLSLVLSREEIERILKAASNLRGKALLTLIYSSGLRVNEAIRLKTSDVLSERGQIRVRGGKGKKDRYTVLGDRALEVLRTYYDVCRPKEWLFPGRDAGSHISQRTARRIFNRAKERAGINSEATIHSLRHAFATHLYENGENIRAIQKLMGHARLETTLRYTHAAKPAAERVRSPLDSLGNSDEMS